MAVRAFDLVFIPTLEGAKEETLPQRTNPKCVLRVLTKTDTPEEETDLESLVMVRLQSDDLTPSSFSGPDDYLVSARKAVVESIKHFTGQEEEIRPFSAQETAVEVVNHLIDASEAM